MWTRNHLTLSTLAVIGVLVAGCGGAVDGSAQPVSTSAHSSSSSQQTDSALPDGDGSERDLPQNGAPEVEDPLDVSMLRDDLCAAMTEEQAKQFPGDFAGSETDDKGYCTWAYEGDIGYLGFVSGKLRTANSEGLSKYYGKMDSNDANSSPIDPVNSYPAVRFDLGLTSDGNCSIIVGFKDDLTYDILVELKSDHPSYDEPCEVARKFAGVVVDNLKDAQ